MADEAFAPRLHVLLARAGPGAVVFRRGPSKRVATFSWDRDTDAVALGQWLKGRIYERRSDLSPDGRHLIYFAFNGKRRSETGGSWTAVSRAPYLHALDLYAKGDCWEGGGLFATSSSYWLNNRYAREEDLLRDNSGLKRDAARPQRQFGAECTGVYYPRLLRDGWTLIERDTAGRWNSSTVFEKPLANDWTLRKLAHEQVDHPPGKGCYWDSHELRNAKTGAVVELPDWEWAEWDLGALVWAEHGKLYRSALAKDGALAPALVHDFTDYVFETVKAPYESDGEVILSHKARKRKARKSAKRDKERRSRV